MGGSVGGLVARDSRRQAQERRQQAIEALRCGPGQAYGVNHQSQDGLGLGIDGVSSFPSLDMPMRTSYDVQDASGLPSTDVHFTDLPSGTPTVKSEDEVGTPRTGDIETGGYSLPPEDYLLAHGLPEMDSSGHSYGEVDGVYPDFGVVSQLPVFMDGDEFNTMRHIYGGNVCRSVDVTSGSVVTGWEPYRF